MQGVDKQASVLIDLCPLFMLKRHIQANIIAGLKFLCGFVIKMTNNLVEVIVLDKLLWYLNDLQYLANTNAAYAVKTGLYARKSNSKN